MSEPLYTSDDQRAPSSLGVHLPLALLALTTAVFLGTQIRGAHAGGKGMRWQLENIDKQIENLKTAQKQYGEQIQKGEELVKQAGQVQEQYTKLLTDVIELAQDDDDAKKVIQKWNIQRNQPPAGGGAAASGTGGGATAGSTDAKPAGQ